MKIVSLIGSNRGEKSTSQSLVNYLTRRFPPGEMPVANYYARHMYHRPHKQDVFFQELGDCELLILSAPVYVDLLSAPLTHVLETARERIGKNGLKGKKMLAIIHSGYPEPQQRRPSLEMCRFFAREMGMEWCGGLSFGGTSPISGQALEDVGGMTKGIRSSLDQVAGKISEGGLAGTDALTLEDLSVIPIPAWLVKLMMNALTWRKAKKDGIKNLTVKPHGTTRE